VGRKSGKGRKVGRKGDVTCRPIQIRQTIWEYTNFVDKVAVCNKKTVWPFRASLKYWRKQIINGVPSRIKDDTIIVEILTRPLLFPLTHTQYIIYSLFITLFLPVYVLYIMHRNSPGMRSFFFWIVFSQTIFFLYCATSFSFSKKGHRVKGKALSFENRIRPLTPIEPFELHISDYFGSPLRFLFPTTKL